MYNKKMIEKEVLFYNKESNNSKTYYSIFINFRRFK